MFSFDVCSGPLLNTNAKFFNTKGCSSSSPENLEKKENLCVPDFLDWGWIVSEGSLTSPFLSFEAGVARLRSKPRSQPLRFLHLLHPWPAGCWSLSSLVQQPPGDPYGMLKAANYAPSSHWRILEEFETSVPAFR